MQVGKFSFEVLKNKFYEQPLKKVGSKEIRIVSDDCIKYMNKYFFQSVNDNYYFWNAESKQFVLHTVVSLKSVYFSKLAKQATSATAEAVCSSPFGSLVLSFVFAAPQAWRLCFVLLHFFCLPFSLPFPLPPR